MKQQSKSPGFINWGFRVSGLIAVLIGGYWFVAWLDGKAGQLSAQSYATGTVIMKTNMALSQLLAGLTIFLIGIKTRYRLIHITATILSGIVLFTGFLTLGEHLLHFDLGIDQIITKELRGAAGTSSPNRMGLIGAFCITLLGAGLLLILGNRRKYASRLGIIICLIILVPSVGYLLDIHTFFSKPLSTGIAWPTVVSLTALGAGLIFSNNDGIISMFFTNEPGGLLLRRLLPAILLIPLILGFLVIRGHHLNLFDIQTGTGGLVIAVIILFLILAILTARAINNAYAARRIAEKELEESEKKYRELVKNAPAGIYEVDFRTGRFTSVNDSMCLLTGYSRDEFLSMSAFDLLDDEGKKTFQNRVGRWLSGEKPDDNIEYRVKAKDGRIIYTVLNVKFSTDENGNPLGATVVAHDITERKRIEDEMQILAKFPSENPNPVLRLSNDARILYTNDAGQLVLKKWNTAVGEMVPEELRSMVREIVANGTPGTFEIECFDKIFFFYAAPVIDARYINFYGSDVTERRKSELALQASEEKYRMIVELSMEGIVIGRPDGIIQFVNKRFADMLGYDPEEIIGKSGNEFFYDQEQVIDVKATRKLLQRGEVMQKDFKFRRKNGSLLYTLYNVTPIFDSDGIHIGNLAMHSDITERKNAEEALKKSEERLKQALESGNIGIWDWDLKTNAVFWDERTEKMFDLDRGEFGQTYSSFADFVHEEDMPLIEKSLKDTLENDLPFESIYRIKTKTGALRYISSKGHLLKDNEGKPVKISGVCSDITDLKVGSEKLISKINEELLRSNKELENFAYIASHDLQEPLRMVSSFTQLLEMKYKDKLDSQALEYIQFSVEGSRRMYDLLNGLLAYSRIHTKGKEFDRVDLNKVLEDAIKCLTLKIQERNAIIRSADLPHVRGDYSQLILIFQNIISNGIKFNNGTPRINISVTSINDYYQISVKDNGIGINPVYFEKIFQMFQRLLPKDQYEGTGIGLAICRRIVERHGGTIWVESKPGKGSVFSFTIPK